MLTPVAAQTVEVGAPRLDPRTSVRVRLPTPELALVVADVCAVALLAAVVLTAAHAPVPVADRSTSGPSATDSGRPVPVLFVVAGEGSADALAGAPAAGVLGGPVLPVDGRRLSPAVRDELARRHPARIVVLGGPGAVSDAVAAELEDFTSGTVTRLAGQDRYATAAAVATTFFDGPVEQVLVANGSGSGLEPTGPAAGSAAGARPDGPVLLVTRTGVPAATAAALRELAPRRILVLGSASEVSEQVVRALQDSTTGPVTRVRGRGAPPD